MKKEITIDGKTYVLKEETKCCTKPRNQLKFKEGDWVKRIWSGDKAIDIFLLGKKEGENIFENDHFIRYDKNENFEKDLCNNSSVHLTEMGDRKHIIMTEEEIESHLIKEAKRRGFVKGVEYCSARLTESKETIQSNLKYYSKKNTSDLDDMLTDGWGGCVYYGGKWGRIIKEEPISIGEHEVEFNKGEIKVGCKTIKNEDVIFIEKAIEVVLHLGLPITLHEDGDIGVGDELVHNEDFNKIIEKLK
jgi:hypothetical protein